MRPSQVNQMSEHRNYRHVKWGGLLDRGWQLCFHKKHWWSKVGDSAPGTSPKAAVNLRNCWWLSRSTSGLATTCNYCISSRTMASSSLPSRSYTRGSHWQTKPNLAKRPWKSQAEVPGWYQLSQHWQRCDISNGISWVRAKESIWRGEGDAGEGWRTLSHCRLTLRFWGEAEIKGKRKKRD